MLIDFHIYLQSLSVKTTKIYGYSCYQKKNKVEFSSLPFFKISLKIKRRKNDTERPRISGNFLLSVDDRKENLERESVLARACELPIGLLIGSNIFSRGEFGGKGITSEMKITVL